MTPAALVLAHHTWLEAWHGRLIAMLIAMAGLALGLQWFINAIALVERDASGLSIAAPVLRLVAVIITAAIGSNLICRELTDRRVELLLSAPISRLTWVMGRMLGMAAVAWLTACFAGSAFLISASLYPLAAWAISLAFELMLVAALTVAVSVALQRQAISLLAILILYCASRLIGVVHMLAQSDIPGVAGSGAASSLTGLLSIVLPRLSLFAPTQWLTETVDSAAIAHLLGAGAIQCGIYLAILLFACSLDFSRDLD